MAGKTVCLNLRVSEYGNRVLGVVKEKFGFRDKSEALAKVLELYGDDFVDREVKDEVVLEVIREAEAMDKKRLKPVSFEELDKICGLK